MAHILLMEDDLAVGQEISRKLEANGHDVDLVRNGSDALHHLTHQPYDVLLSDIIVKQEFRAVPDGGLLLINRIRRSDPNMLPSPGLPIIAISGTVNTPGMENILTTAKQMGADICFEKPINMVEILTAIDELAPPRPQKEARQ